METFRRRLTVFRGLRRRRDEVLMIATGGATLILRERFRFVTLPRRRPRPIRARSELAAAFRIRLPLGFRLWTKESMSSGAISVTNCFPTLAPSETALVWQADANKAKHPIQRREQLHQ